MSLNIALALTNALKDAGLPVAGVHIGAPGDKATWTIDWAQAPTLAQETLAATTITAFDPADAAVLSAQQDADAAQRFDGNKMLKAKALSDLAFRLGKAPGTLTNAEITAERSRIIAIYKSL